MTSSIDVLIVILVHNGAPWLPDLISALERQESRYTFEVLSILNNCTDDSDDILTSKHVPIHKISTDTFSHSGTRNLALTQNPQSRYVLYLSQDARPLGSNWLNEMVSSIEENSALKALCAMELHNESNPFAVSGVAAYVFRNKFIRGTYTIPAYSYSDSEKFCPMQRRHLFAFSNVCAIYEREYLQDHPFNETVDYGEDLHWAIANSERGYLSGCTSRAQVFHRFAHSEKEQKTKLARGEQMFAKLFGPLGSPLKLKSIQFLKRLIRKIAGPTGKYLPG